MSTKYCQKCSTETERGSKSICRPCTRRNQQARKARIQKAGGKAYCKSCDTVTKRDRAGVCKICEIKYTKNRMLNVSTDPKYCKKCDAVTDRYNDGKCSLCRQTQGKIRRSNRSEEQRAMDAEYLKKWNEENRQKVIEYKQRLQAEKKAQRERDRSPPIPPRTDELKFCKACQTFTKRDKDSKCTPCRRSNAAKRRTKLTDEQLKKQTKYLREYRAKMGNVRYDTARYQTYRAKLKRSPGDGFTNAYWEDLKKTCDWKCAYCGKDLSTASSKRIHIEHVYPLKLGGWNDPINLTVSCLWCNSTKNRKSVLTIRRNGWEILDLPLLQPYLPNPEIQKESLVRECDDVKVILIMGNGSVVLDLHK